MPSVASRSLVVMVALAVTAAGFASAQESKGTATAHAELARGRTASDAKDYAAAESAFRKAIELDPAWPQAHFSYQEAVRYVARSGKPGEPADASDARYVEMVGRQYEAWIKAHPKNAAYLWAYGSILAEADETAKAEALCKEALALDAAFAAAYRTLARIARLRGDVKADVAYLKKTVEAAPDNAGYLQSYIFALRPVDAAAARTLALQFVERFPSDPTTRTMLLDLAGYSDDIPTKIRYLEQAKQQFGGYPPLLFDLYSQTDPQKAVSLARELANTTRSQNEAVQRADRLIWTDVAALEEAAIRARGFLDDKRFAEALALLRPGPPRSSGFTNTAGHEPASSINREMALLTAEAEAGLGQYDKAYSRVMDVFIRQPGDRVYAFLSRFGQAAGKPRAAIDDDVRTRLVAAGTPAPDFRILTYPDGRRGSLSDLRGSVVLLTFWFPT